MNILVTGADGFIGQNLILKLESLDGIQISKFTRANPVTNLPDLVSAVDIVFHLAGVNRPCDESEFTSGNKNLTDDLIDAVMSIGRDVPIIFASSTQAELDNPYGKSKRAAEDALLTFHEETGNPVAIFRLPNVFGKLARPNYNSVVATFCHNIANDLPIDIHDPQHLLRLVYIDDVVASFANFVTSGGVSSGFMPNLPEHQMSVGDLANKLHLFRASRKHLTVERVGSDIDRKLYATFVSYLSKENFVYPLKHYSDNRGDFVEFLKTLDSGQFSYFSAKPGITRGGHYHHTKTEKFLVVSGSCLFRFKHAVTGETYQLKTSSKSAEVVEVVPGWSHDITNIGSDDLVCLVWANEVFDRLNPDTFHHPIDQEELATSD